MPAPSDKAAFDAAYSKGAGIPTYRRPIMQPSRTWMARLTELGRNLPGFTPGKNVLVVGCGYGWILEYAIDQFNHDRIWGTDTSAWIQANLDDTGDLGEAQARPDVVPLIFDIDVHAPNAVQQFRSAGAGQQGRFDWVITDSVIESYDDTEIGAFLDGCERVLRPQGNVGHLFTAAITPPGPDDRHDRTLGFTWRTFAEAVALRPSHYWLDLYLWQFGGGA